MTSEPSREIPDGGSPGPRGPWPDAELIGPWLGDQDLDFELRPGEDLTVHDDPAAMAAARRFRDVLGRFASGVTVVTSLSDDEPVGLTCQAFSSVSLEPPLVLFIPAKSSRSWPRIRRSGAFCVNILAADQTALATTMASRGADKFADVTWSPSPVTGSPILHGALAHVDCMIHAVHEAGDHDVVLGRVVDLITEDELAREPLLFYRGAYRTTDPR